MTLLIAAVASDGIVCATDRRTSSASDYWDDSVKVFDLTPEWTGSSIYMLHAGDFERGNYLIDECERLCRGAPEGDFDVVAEAVENVLAGDRERLLRALPPHVPVPQNHFILAGYRGSQPVIWTYRPPVYLVGRLHHGWAVAGVEIVARYLMRSLYREGAQAESVKRLLAFVMHECSRDIDSIGGGMALQEVHPDRKVRMMAKAQCDELLERVQGGLAETSALGLETDG